MIYLVNILIAILFNIDNYPHESPVHSEGTNGLSIICLAPLVYGGDRSESEIIEKVQLKINYYTACYAGNFSGQRPETFKVRYRFTIKPSGIVTKVEPIYSGTKNQSFVNCIQDILQQIIFQRLPNNAGDTVVEQSILFRFTE